MGFGDENEMTDPAEPCNYRTVPKGSTQSMKQYDFIEADDSYDMAVEWMRNGNIEKAIVCFNHAIELNPRYTYAYIMLARAHASKNNYTDAVHVLKKASRADPDFDRLPYLMAKYSYKNGDYKNALMFIDRAIEIDGKELYLYAKGLIEEMYHRR